jgi:hypothetical protein
MRFQFTAVRYYGVTQAREEGHCYRNSKKLKFQPKKGCEKPCV